MKSLLHLSWTPGWRRALAVALLLALLPSYLRAYSIAGDSEAPNHLAGDLVVANLAAYDLRLPYSDVVLFSLSDPRPGDVVLFDTREGQTFLKRVVAGPGDRVEVRDQRLRIHGNASDYRVVDPTSALSAEELEHAGAHVLEEALGASRHLISFTRSADGGFGPVTVPPDSWFVLGDHRDNSRDSRHFGAVARERIRGKVLGRILR